MKMQTLIAIFACLSFMTVSTARANDATCMDRHEDLAAKLMTKAVSQNIAAMLAKKGISLDLAHSTFEIAAAQVKFETDGVYGYFGISDGTVTTKDGTKLTVEFKLNKFNAEDSEAAYFKPVLKSSGFDKEGNAIAPHCMLVADNVGVTNRAEFISISNTTTGRVIGRVELPSRVSLY